MPFDERDIESTSPNDSAMLELRGLLSGLLSIR